MIIWRGPFIPNATRDGPTDFFLLIYDYKYLFGVVSCHLNDPDILSKVYYKVITITLHYSHVCIVITL